jgi:hypothetical protein
VVNHVRYFERVLGQKPIEIIENFFVINWKLFTIADASVKFPNFCLINGLKVYMINSSNFLKRKILLALSP